MNGSRPSDAEIPALTSAMRRCDEAAWRRFHDAYYDVLFRAALARGVTEADAPDAVQRTYLRIMKHLKPFADEPSFRSWICCLLRSEVIDAARAARRRQDVLDRLRRWTRTVAPSSPSCPDDPLADMALPAKRLLRRHYVEGWLQSELAAEAGVSVKAIESKLARLRRQARTLLEARGETLP